MHRRCVRVESFINYDFSLALKDKHEEVDRRKLNSRSRTFFDEGEIFLVVDIRYIANDVVGTLLINVVLIILLSFITWRQSFSLNGLLFSGMVPPLLLHLSQFAGWKKFKAWQHRKIMENISSSFLILPEDIHR